MKKDLVDLKLQRGVKMFLHIFIHHHLNLFYKNEISYGKQLLVENIHQKI